MWTIVCKYHSLKGGGQPTLLYSPTYILAYQGAAKQQFEDFVFYKSIVIGGHIGTIIKS